MGNTCRFVVNAVGKGGETYHTHCKDRKELNKWITEHEEKLSMQELKVVDKTRNPFLKWLKI